MTDIDHSCNTCTNEQQLEGDTFAHQNQAATDPDLNHMNTANLEFLMIHT